MLCRSGLAMSPMKNPKLSVAASSTKKPKMTFSRFMPLLPDRIAGAWSPRFEVIKLSHVRLGLRPHRESALVFDPRVDVVASGFRRIVGSDLGLAFSTHLTEVSADRRGRDEHIGS